MRCPSDHELLTAWEQGLGRPPVERALALLASASQHEGFESLAELSIGQRDARLLDLRESLLGPQLVCIDDCPDCGARVELDLSAADVRAWPCSDWRPDESGRFQFETDGIEFRFHTVTSRDLALSASGRSAIGAAVRQLLKRCVISIRKEGRELSFDDVPESALEALTSAMAEADPQADVQVGVACPACGSRWATPLNIDAYFWAELDEWARRLLRDVHDLAVAYGWSERDILAMSARRRRLYLEVLAG
jgi:hypothetical protein